MASCFVATEKETRFPLWKSGRKVGIIKWVDLESNWSPVSFLLRHILHLFHSHKLQIQVMNKRPDLLVDLRGEVLRHGGESSIGPGIGRAVPADEPVGNVDVSLVVLRLPVFDQKVAYRVGESLQLGELLHPCAVSVNIRECSYRAALQDIKPGVNLGLTAGGQPYELGNEAGTDDGGLFAFDQGNRHLREKRQQVFAEEALRERPFLWELAGVFEEGMYPGDTAFGVLVLDTVAGLGVVFHYFSGADAALKVNLVEDDGTVASDADAVFVDEAFEDDGVKDGGKELGEVRRAVGSQGLGHDVLGERVHFVHRVDGWTRWTMVDKELWLNRDEDVVSELRNTYLC